MDQRDFNQQDVNNQMLRLLEVQADAADRQARYAKDQVNYMGALALLAQKQDKSSEKLLLHSKVQARFSSIIAITGAILAVSEVVLIVDVTTNWLSVNNSGWTALAVCGVLLVMLAAVSSEFFKVQSLYKQL